MTRVAIPILAGTIIAALAISLALAIAIPFRATADGGRASLVCVDSNDNGIIDRIEAIGVLRQYLSGDPIPGPYDVLTSDPELPPFVEWEIQPSVRQWEAESVVLGVKVMYQFGEGKGIPVPNENIVVYVDNDFDRLVEWYSSNTGVNLESARQTWENARVISRMGMIIVKTSNPYNNVWVKRTGLGNLEQTVMREYVYAAMQYGLAGQQVDPDGFKDHARVATPRWLSSGMATVLKEMAVSEYLGVAYPRPGHRQSLIANVLNSPIDIPLENTEVWPTSGDPNERSAIQYCVYACGYLAVELLASFGPEWDLPEYFRLLKSEWFPLDTAESDYPHPGWRTAFQQAYGLTVDQFYSLYEEHKWANFPVPE